MGGGLAALQYVRNCITEYFDAKGFFTDRILKKSITVALKLVFV